MMTIADRQMTFADAFLALIPEGDTVSQRAFNHQVQFALEYARGAFLALPDYTNRPSDYAAETYVLDMLTASGDIIDRNDTHNLLSIRAVPSIEGGNCTDVEFTLSGRTENYDCRATVWYEQREDGSLYLYGEW